MSDRSPYNPLDRNNLGASVASALLSQDAAPLREVDDFTGAGIYAIYYVGDFPAYEQLSDRNRSETFSTPIYVGKAIPRGSRSGTFGLSTDPGPVLAHRLREHAKSIEDSSNLSINDFYCRYLVVEDIWIPLGESLLIARFTPPWNKVVGGFGNHDPGRGRYRQAQSRWDVLHPGRSWSLKCQPRAESAIQVQNKVKEYLRSLGAN